MFTFGDALFDTPMRTTFPTYRQKDILGRRITTALSRNRKKYFVLISSSGRNLNRSFVSDISHSSYSYKLYCGTCRTDCSSTRTSWRTYHWNHRSATRCRLCCVVGSCCRRRTTVGRRDEGSGRCSGPASDIWEARPGFAQKYQWYISTIYIMINIMIFSLENVMTIMIFIIFSVCEEYFGIWKNRKCFDFEIQTGRRLFCRKEQMKRLLYW